MSACRGPARGRHPNPLRLAKPRAASHGYGGTVRVPLKPAHPLGSHWGGFARDFFLGGKKKRKKRIFFFFCKKIVAATDLIRFYYFYLSNIDSVPCQLWQHSCLGYQQKNLPTPSAQQQTQRGTRSPLPGKLDPLMLSLSFRRCHPYSGLGDVQAKGCTCPPPPPLPRGAGTRPQLAQRGKPAGPDGDGAEFYRLVSSIPQAQWVCQKWLIIPQMG